MKNEIDIEDVKKKINSIFETFEELKELNAISKFELSEIDKELSNHYHNIEGSDINYMSDSHFLMMKLKDILYRRRDAKINLTLLDSFVSSLDGQIVKSKQRTVEIINKHEEIIKEIKKRAK